MIAGIGASNYDPELAGTASESTYSRRLRDAEPIPTLNSRINEIRDLTARIVTRRRAIRRAAEPGDPR